MAENRAASRSLLMTRSMGQAGITSSLRVRFRSWLGRTAVRGRRRWAIGPALTQHLGGRAGGWGVGGGGGFRVHTRAARLGPTC
jgi:hypothetical protein